MPKQQPPTKAAAKPAAAKPAPIGRRELAQEIATRMAGVSESQVYELLGVFTAVTTAYLRAGRAVALTGFGTWTPTVRAQRMGTNLRTREKIVIPERRAANFSLGAHLKTALAGT